MLAIIKFTLGWLITIMVFLLCFLYRLLIWDFSVTGEDYKDPLMIQFAKENLGEKTYRVMFFKQNTKLKKIKDILKQ